MRRAERKPSKRSSPKAAVRDLYLPTWLCRQISHAWRRMPALSMCWSTTPGFHGSDRPPNLDVATFDSLFASNVRSAYFLVAAIAPKMVERRSGCIINLGSMAGQIGLAGGAAYGATKAAQAAMARAWAAEFSPRGVRVNAVAPGPVFTAGAAPDRTEKLGSTTLPNRTGQAKEIAEVVAFLASPTSRSMPGASIAVGVCRTAT